MCFEKLAHWARDLAQHCKHLPVKVMSLIPGTPPQKKEIGSCDCGD